jgi:sugar phosphate isomerase/epimerase
MSPHDQYTEPGRKIGDRFKSWTENRRGEGKAMTWRLSGFADEAGLPLASQIEVTRQSELRYLDLRGVGEYSVVNLPIDQAKQAAESLRESGLAVNMFGSPIGKVDIADDFEDQRQKLAHLAQLAEIFDCRDVRVFSFFNQHGASLSAWGEQSIAWLSALRDQARELGLRLWCENERFTYADRCAEVLHVAQSLCDGDSFYMIFDFDNFNQSGDDCWANWQQLKPYVGAFHLKESTRDGSHVPVGEGAGQIEAILRDALDSGWDGPLSMEPHLARSEAVMATGPHGQTSQTLSHLGDQEVYVYGVQVAHRLLSRIGADYS